MDSQERETRIRDRIDQPTNQMPPLRRDLPVISSEGNNLEPRIPVGLPATRRRTRGTVVAALVDMITRERVETVLDRVRPFIQADGGDIELVDVDGNSARVRLTGMCAHCPSAHMTLHVGIETVLREEIPEFETLRVG